MLKPIGVSQLGPGSLRQGLTDLKAQTGCSHPFNRTHTANERAFTDLQGKWGEHEQISICLFCLRAPIFQPSPWEQLLMKPPFRLLLLLNAQIAYRSPLYCFIAHLHGTSQPHELHRPTCKKHSVDIPHSSYTSIHLAKSSTLNKASHVVFATDDP